MTKPLSPKHVEPYDWDDLIDLLTSPYAGSRSAKQAAEELIAMKDKIDQLESKLSSTIESNISMAQLLQKYIDQFGVHFNEYE